MPKREILMYQIITLLLVVSIFLTGCATKVVTKEEKKQMHREVSEYNSEVFSPIILLSYAACVEQNKSGNFFKSPSSLGPSSPFSNFEAHAEDNIQSLSFRLNSSNIFWLLQPAIIYKDGEIHCKSTVKASHNKNSTVFKVSSTIPLSQIDKSKWKDTSFDIFAQSTMEINYKLYPSLSLTEKSRPKPTTDESNKFISFFTSVLLNATVCAVLDVEQNQCQMSSISSVTDNKTKKKLEFQKEKLRIKKNGAKKRLRDKMENNAT